MGTRGGGRSPGREPLSEPRHPLDSANLRRPPARLPPGDGGAIVDLLFASSGIEPELIDAAEPLELLPGLTVAVATVGDLLALKVLARDDDTRPQDSGDIRGLVRAANEEDLARAMASVGLISARGFARGRDLPALLEQAIEKHRPG